MKVFSAAGRLVLFVWALIISYILLEILLYTPVDDWIYRAVEVSADRLNFPFLCLLAPRHRVFYGDFFETYGEAESRAKCFAWYKGKRGNYGYCQEIGSKISSHCWDAVFDYASSRGDCGFLYGNVSENVFEMCLSYVAVKKGDHIYCEQIDSDAGRDQCLKRLYLSFGNVSRCNNLDPGYMEQCITNLTVPPSDESVCQDALIIRQTVF